MNEKILVAYASKGGSTKKVAARMAEIAAKHGINADILPVSAVKNLESYDTVVLGSAIRMGRVLPEALAFVEKNQIELKKKEFDAFVMCMTLSTFNEENLKASNALLDPVRTLVEPVHSAAFAGEVNMKTLSLFDRMIIKMVKSQVGDFQDWNRMETWMESVLQPNLHGAQA